MSDHGQNQSHKGADQAGSIGKDDMSGDITGCPATCPLERPSTPASARKGGDPFGAFHMTSTQIGAVGEALVASGMILASSGRLAPFRPFADDSGHDLLVYDKLTRRSLPVQIKCRTRVDSNPAGTVQFDVQLSTFAREGGGFLLCVLMTADVVKTCWLIPADELEALSRRRSGKLIIVASPKAGTRDKYLIYRHDTLADATRTLVAQFGG